MAFFLRRPFAVPTALRQVPKTANTARFFHNSPFKPSQSKPLGPATSSIFAKSRQTFQNAFRRTYMQPTYNAAQGGNLTQRLLYGAAIVGGTILATNMIFNRETREDGGMAPYERSYLNETFMHTGLGIAIIGIAARAMHMNGWSYRLMAMNPWLVAGLGLVGSIGTMYGTYYTSPDNYLAKYGLWTAFNVTQAALLSPLMFMHPALLARAGLYTVGMMGSIAFVGATAKQDKYLYLGAPLLAGVTIVALSGLAPLVLPATATRTLMWSEKIWLYGGLAVFGGFTLYDVQKVLHHSRMAQRGLIRRDVVNESISLELDFINIFIRMVQILAMQRNNRK
ncbi:inhibitor of apoptosis-promoting Bax1-domain-containing protein [Aspergillus pseudotamarii]|uniref:Inhibitor of apoptosis-promoting Bax1-domain-containing protein n=1 Tax=Aspergillus pseudotamarii TaxID=132259 RepID=A0A5N6SGP3_ASPPS|nr:inhibitor of apoptosis-promoting Bax1-domain-containing protein [Aspergillus pseudotamarii]KAE8133067.1 inhibitor of apoptosis-promoting Bax1-domain-containing protein [Aspergillus pseudotamarii]